MWDYDYPPSPRPAPRLAWAAPVDIIELGTSLEAYERQLPAVTTLRLCHRFGDGSLSQLPQEILDHVVSEVHQEDKAAIKPKWERNFACFQGRCTPAQHFEPNQIKRIWAQNADDILDDEESTLEARSYTTGEKTKMVEDFINRSLGKYSRCNVTVLLLILSCGLVRWFPRANMGAPRREADGLAELAMHLQTFHGFQGGARLLTAQQGKSLTPFQQLGAVWRIQSEVLKHLAICHVDMSFPEPYYF